MNRGEASQQQFFDKQNKVFLMKNLVAEFTESVGPMQSREQNRLARTLDHYMTEVWDTNGPMPIGQLNREAISATASDFSSYLRRSNIQMVVPPQQQPLRTVPSALTTGSPNVPQRAQYESNGDDRLSLDTGTRFEQLQQERTGSKGPRPPPPDFRIPIEDESIPAVNLYEQIKKQREDEASRGAIALVNTNQSDRSVRPAILDDPNANMTLAVPSITPLVQPIIGTSAQEMIIKQDSVITYRETEKNLFVYSADRDWVNNTRDTRYNFTVNFQSGNNSQGFAYGPTSQEKFKNIVRIELVKAIVPTEGLDMFVVNTGSGTAPAYDSSTRLNVLGYPYIVTRIPELDGNNYGTDDSLDNAFGILQYDANWISDSVSAYVNSRGYLAMIPKFMKCQKSYSPSPLATLNKLTIQLNRPDGTTLSSNADTFNISQIFSSGLVPGTITGTKYAGAGMSNTSNAFYYLFYTGSNNYFSQYALSAGDRVQLGGLTSALYPSSNSVAANDMATYFQNKAGLPVISIGYSNGGAWIDGPNAAGYANFFVLRAQYNDPSTGLTTVSPFGGSSNANGGLAIALSNTGNLSGVRAINLSHQTQVVFRIITREHDSTSRVRADNL